MQTGTWQILGPALTEQISGKAMWGPVLSVRGIGLLVMSAVMYRLVVGHLLRLGQLMSALGALPLLALGAHLTPVVACRSVPRGAGLRRVRHRWETSGE
ncbi:hypothetical protein AB0G60_26635 [Streptomyces angustmyceticus]|uniref:Uncharacterized protein n=1 Tax=Streptomyces angustmyceticus TaxID=285578 RepID=A0A5J4LTK9_9ACTN|nr:hypothetical protein [Streptomyces angustmyceticus]UAL65979.1 hypothetical protein K7396_05000 [Streptomyces angustmyceticus]GES33618.1 hypothetical protein San01_61060 [Streptomyces angustmyceticus]